MREPLFILCPGWSFSSVVCAVIGQHPQAFGLPEVHLFAAPTVGDLIDLDTPLFGRVGATGGLKRAVAELVYDEQSFDTIEAAGKWLAQHRKMTGAGMFRELCSLVGDRVVVDKSPTNSHPERLETLFQGFPNARYLHLSRHPRSVCRSMEKISARRPRHNSLSEADREEYWFSRHVAIMEFSQRLDPAQYMFLHGEWFFESPELVLTQICEWLDLSTDADAIAQMMQPEQSPFAVLGPDNARYGNNIGFIEKPHLRVGKIPRETMDGPMDWVTDHEAHFSDQTRSLAYQLGYE